MYGAIIGDIAGSVYEFNNYCSKDFQPLIHPTAKYTDDTVCTIAIADSLMNNIPPTKSLRDWGREYWHLGQWGAKFARWLARNDDEPYNSYGNGSAMRVSPCAWIATTYDEAIALSKQVTIVTHNHPEGIKGALATTTAIFMARQQYERDDIRAHISKTFDYDLSRSIEEIRANNPHSEACQDTVPEAIICALDSTSFEDSIRNAISIGGDSDTIAAITGSIAEAMYEIPPSFRATARNLLTDQMNQVIDQFYKTIN